MKKGSVSKQWADSEMETIIQAQRRGHKNGDVLSKMMQIRQFDWDALDRLRMELGLPPYAGLQPGGNPTYEE